jgi:hypothetical protein
MKANQWLVNWSIQLQIMPQSSILHKKLSPHITGSSACKCLMKCFVFLDNILQLCWTFVGVFWTWYNFLYSAFFCVQLTRIWPTICHFSYLSIYLPICTSIYLSLYLSIYLPIHLFIYLALPCSQELTIGLHPDQNDSTHHSLMIILYNFMSV